MTRTIPSPTGPAPSSEAGAPHLSRDRLAAIVATQQEIATAGPDLGTVMEVATRHAQLLTGAGGAVVELVDGEELVYRAGSGTLAAYMGLRLRREASLSGLCTRTGAVLRCDDSERDDRVDADAARRVGARSMVVVPLVRDGGTIGVLKVISGAPGAFAEPDVHALQLIAGLLSASLDAARRFEAITSLLRERKRVQDALEESEARFRNALEFAPIGMALVGVDGRWIAVNRALCELVGYTEEELRSLTFQDITHPDDLDADLENVLRLLRGEVRSYEMEKRYIHRDGHPVWILLSASLVRDAAGEPLHFVAQVQDVTARVEAERRLTHALERFRLAARATRDPIWDWDVETGRVEWSEAVEPTFGYAPAEVEPVRSWWRERLHPDDAERVEASLRAAAAGAAEFWAEEYRFRRGDGAYADVLDRGFVLRDEAGAPLRMIGSMVDLTERVRMEQALRHAGAELARSNEELQQFAYVASHDLQEPLRKIQAFGDRLRSRYAAALDEQGLDYVERMHGAASRMQLLIQDLLAYSRVTSAGREFVPVELSRLAAEVISDLQARVESSGATVAVDPLPVMEADPTQMRQLLQNLIGNALKFHRPGVAPEVRVSAPAPDGETVELAVADRGIGFEPKYLDRIFAPFQRLHGRNEYEGTGMGLAICRKIVDRHGGTITADSTPGEGTVFRVTLPRTRFRAEGRTIP